MELVVVAAFRSIVDLSHAKACLQNHGIECYVRDEHSAQVKESYNVLLGGIKLEVKDEDAPAAIKLLIDNGFIKSEPETTVSFLEKLNLVQRFLLFLILFILFIGIVYLLHFLSN
jgi:hypothetical protein